MMMSLADIIGDQQGPILHTKYARYAATTRQPEAASAAYQSC